MSRWNYEPEAAYLNEYNSIKKGLFGKKLVNNNIKSNAIHMPRGSKVKVKVENNNIALYINNKLFNEAQFNKFWFDENKPNILYAKRGADNKIIMIDCLTGKHTPVVEKIRNQGVKEPYLIDSNGHILKINDDLTTTDTGLVRVKESIDLYMTPNNIVVKNAEGKYVLLNPATLEPLIDKEFDNEDIEAALYIAGKTINEPDLRVFSNKKDFYFLDKNTSLLGIFKADSISHFRSDEQSIRIVRLYDKNKNTTTLIKIDVNKNEIVETKKFRNLVCDYYMKDGKKYFITSDKDKKMGVVDENDNQIIPNKYDNLEVKLMDSKASNDEDIKRDNDEILLVEEQENKGVFSLEGKELLPCEFKEVILEQSIKLDDTYRFMAQTKDDACGVMNSKGEIEISFDHTLSKNELLVKEKSSEDDNYHKGIILLNKPPKNRASDSEITVSIYVKEAQNCHLSDKDVEVKKSLWNSHSIRSINTKSILNGTTTNQSETSGYSSLDIFMYGSIIGNLVGNPGLGQVIANGMMSSDMSDSDDCSDEMDY